MTDLTETLRGRGYRLTPQRLMVWEVLASEGPHLSAEQVHARIAERYPNVNISTVYRTLDLLVCEGLAKQAQLGGGKRIYEVSADEDHHHLVCRQCEHVQHIDAAHLGELQDHLIDEHGFEVDRMVLTSYGRCLRCRTGSRKTPG